MARALARHLYAAHGRACLSRAPCRANSRRGCAATHAKRWEGCAPQRSASARVQAYGGAVAIYKGELVFDGVAISDTSATVRRPSDARAGWALPPSCRGGPAPDRCRAQDGASGGGAICMNDGNVTFRGSSTITRTRAVRPARRTPSRAHALLILACGAGTGTGSGT